MKIKLSRPFGNVVVDVAAAADMKTPMQLKKILVPIDFSTCSKKALQYAVPFARQFRAALVFLHVVPVHFHYADNEIEVESEAVSGAKLHADSSRKLADLIHGAVPDDIRVDAEIRHGVEAAEIVNEARKADVDLIILSTHGRTGRAHSLAGSVAEDVVRLAPCPVLVVRERQHEFVHIQAGQKPLTATAT